MIILNECFLITYLLSKVLYLYNLQGQVRDWHIHWTLLRVKIPRAHICYWNTCASHMLSKNISERYGKAPPLINGQYCILLVRSSPFSWDKSAPSTFHKSREFLLCCDGSVHTALHMHLNSHGNETQINNFIRKIKTTHNCYVRQLNPRHIPTITQTAIIS